MRVEGAGKTPSLTGEFVGETHGPRTYTNPPTQRSVPEGPNLLVVTERVTEIQSRAKQAALFTLRPLPHIQHNAETWVAPPWQIPKPPLITM